MQSGSAGPAGTVNVGMRSNESEDRTLASTAAGEQGVVLFAAHGPATVSPDSLNGLPKKLSAVPSSPRKWMCVLLKAVLIWSGSSSRACCEIPTWDGPQVLSPPVSAADASRASAMVETYTAADGSNSPARTRAQTPPAPANFVAFSGKNRLYKTRGVQVQSTVPVLHSTSTMIMMYYSTVQLHECFVNLEAPHRFRC